MEAFANVLQPYKDIVGQLTTVVTVIQMLSGTFLCWDIYKQGSTRGIGITPLLGGLVLYVLFLEFYDLLIYERYDYWLLPVQHKETGISKSRQ